MAGFDGDGGDECDCLICAGHFNERLAERRAAAQLAATHAAIRALPRYELFDKGFADTPRVVVLDKDLARLLGDPAQEQPK